MDPRNSTPVANDSTFLERMRRRDAEQHHHPRQPRWIEWTRANEKRGKDLTGRTAA